MTRTRGGPMTALYTPLHAPAPTPTPSAGTTESLVEPERPSAKNGGQRPRRFRGLTVAAAGGLLAGLAAPAFARRIKSNGVTRQGRFTAARLVEHALRRRAVEAAIWGMPAVNFERMFHEMVDQTGGGFNQILYW